MSSGFKSQWTTAQPSSICCPVWAGETSPASTAARSYISECRGVWVLQGPVGGALSLAWPEQLATITADSKGGASSHRAHAAGLIKIAVPFIFIFLFRCWRQLTHLLLDTNEENELYG